MVVPSRRAVASLRRASNRPCGQLVPSASLPPRPIYLASVVVTENNHKSRCYSSSSSAVDSEGGKLDGWELVNGRRCFGCGQEGHKLAQCPSKDAKGQVNWKEGGGIERPHAPPAWKNGKGENMWQFMAESKCFVCGLPGHKARNCPVKKAQTPQTQAMFLPERGKMAAKMVAGIEPLVRDMIKQSKLSKLKDEEPLVSAEEELSWPKDYKDDTPSEVDFDKLPDEVRRAIKAPEWWKRDPITADNLVKRMQITDYDLERMAKGGRVSGDISKKKYGAVDPIKKSDVDPEELEGIADLRELNTLIRDERFTESELREIMADEDEPEDDMALLRMMMEVTTKDMPQDMVRLRRHEEKALAEEIESRIAKGMTPEKAEHDARAIMKLPQKITEERKELLRDLSEEALLMVETMSNTELRALGDKGKGELMKELSVEQEYRSRPLKPSETEGYDMYPIPPPRQESEDPSDPKMWDWNSTDISSMAHTELQEHRDARHYARLAVYDMPRLGKFAKPFAPPHKDAVLRFRFTTHMGVTHPSEKKVVVECSPSDFGLTKIQREKLIKICGPRYNPERKLLKFSCEMFPHQHQNKRYLSELVDKLIEEAKDSTDTFEDVPFDFRHHKFSTPRQFPDAWRMRKEKLEKKRLRDWIKHANPEEWQRLQVYLSQKLDERSATMKEREQAQKQLAAERRRLIGR